MYVCMLFLVGRVAITKYHRLCNLNRSLFHHHSRSWKSKKKVAAGLVSRESCLLSLQMTSLLLLFHAAIRLQACPVGA